MSATPDSARRSELVLGIESSCDDTAAAVVGGGREILSSVVVSQVLEHARFGGVVPEIAGRSHLRTVLPVVDRALADAQVDLDDLDAIAVTAKPGLIGSLLVGVSVAKALAFARSLPLVAVDHVEAHVYSATMEAERDPYPCVALVASGGHTALYRADSPLSMQRLSTTLDDAAGEAFDKVAHLLGLPYPGGPSISKLAREGDATRVELPRYRPRLAKGELPPEFPPFSFSGLKTAVLYRIRGQDALGPAPAADPIEGRADIAAAFECAVVDALVEPAIAAAAKLGVGTVTVVGGVACNARLRERMRAAAAERGLDCFFPSPAYCTDNAAMVAGLGFHRWRAGLAADLALDASAR
jgi:N6-L-threonylcarbamoyladenine synthase